MPTSAVGRRNEARMPLQLIKDGRLAESIGKATIFRPPVRCGAGDFTAELIAGRQR
jgi:hypothetical protein